MREIKKGDKYLCKTSNFSNFIKGNVYDVVALCSHSIGFIDALNQFYYVDFEDLKADFTDLQENFVKDKEIESLIKEYGIKPYILNENNNMEVKTNYFKEVYDSAKRAIKELEVKEASSSVYTDALKEIKVNYEIVPSHYDNKSGYDVIDIAKHYNLNFNRGNMVKYIFRAGKKDNELQDLKKALDYLQREIKHLTK